MSEVMALPQQPADRSYYTRSEKRSSYGQSTGIPSPAPSMPSSPSLSPQQAHYQNYAPRSNQMQGIEAALSMKMPLEIPPFNPNNRRQPGQPKQQQQGGVPTPAQSPVQQYSSIPLPVGARTSSQQSSHLVAQQHQTSPSSRIPTAAQNQRPAVMQPPQFIPENLANGRRDAAAHPADGRARSERHQQAPNAPTHQQDRAQGMGIYQPSAGASSGRTKVYFGQYQLLQTLGEGEFGKVKLGVKGDSRWGEEVAIKLIKRGSVQESAQRMTKVVREIEVLKVVKHPNIVRLHDVIETEKYIGIVLDYASGGELFDHILAHRYLKDRDACKLFAQLVSGVAYLHAKKIIHRDLKLENLLLDRNRNIIVTDFGFANRFETRGNDLMSTSCGSPCYAAPELVVQDGKYVGSAVDVWSCGVILYAMLAGYLPFDDDPLNPDSENINLLYKYIMNTPLTFPEWIPQEPRDLLQRMLVPDPTKRCTLADVAQHHWLRKYRPLFMKSVEELEMTAAEQDLQKKMMYERQREAILQQEQAVQMTRSMTSANMRPQSAMVSSTSGMPAFAPSASANAASRPGPTAAPSRRGHAYSAMVVPTVASPESMPTPMPSEPSHMLSALPHSVSVPMGISISAPGRPSVAEDQLPRLPILNQDGKRIPSGEPEQPAAKAPRVDTEDLSAEEARKRKAKAHRYTVQVEYSGSEEPPAAEKVDVLQSPLPMPDSTVEILSEATPISPVPEEASVFEGPPPRIHTPESASPISLRPESGIAPSLASSGNAAEHGHSLENLSPVNGVFRPTTPTIVEDRSSTPPPGKKMSDATTIPFPPSSEKDRIQPAPHDTFKRTGSASSAKPPSTSSASSKHRKIGSGERFSISRLLGSSTNLERAAAGRTDIKDNAGGENNAALDEVTNKRRNSSRRKALSLVVDPFRPASSASSVRSKRNSLRVGREGSSSSSIVTTPTISERPKTRSSVLLESAAPAILSPPERTSSKPPLQQSQKPVNKTGSISSSTYSHTTDPSWVSNGPSAGKAKRVMDWFRWRSMPKDSQIASPAQNRPTPLPLDADRRTGPITRSVTKAQLLQEQQGAEIQPAESTPQVVVTNDVTPVVTPTTPAYPAEIVSGLAANRASSIASSSRSQRPNTADSRVEAPSLQRDASLVSIRNIPAEPFNESRLRFHQGALNNDASLTSAYPPDLIKEIRTVLYSMGMEVREESGPYRLKCTRRSTKKLLPVFPSSNLGASALEGRPGLPSSPSMSLSPSPSSTFRAIFGRRPSTHSVHGGGMPSPALSLSTISHMDTPDPLLSPVSPSPTTMPGTPNPQPFYGANDSGAEIRLTIELTRMRNLPKLYSVDLRRLKGDLFAYRDIYREVYRRLNLATPTQPAQAS